MSQTPQFRGLKCPHQWQFKVRVESEVVNFEIHLSESFFYKLISQRDFRPNSITAKCVFAVQFPGI